MIFAYVLMILKNQNLQNLIKLREINHKDRKSKVKKERNQIYMTLNNRINNWDSEASMISMYHKALSQQTLE